MRVGINSWAGGSNEKVEVSAFVGLIDMIDVELGVPARCDGRARRPRGAPAREFLIGEKDGQASFGNIEFDPIAVFDKSKRSARGGLGRNMEHHRPERGPAHSR